MPLVEKNVVSKYIAEKASSSGLGFDTVRQAFAKDGEKGAKRVLQQPTAEGKARVTDRRNILESICRYLRDNPQQ